MSTNEPKAAGWMQQCILITPSAEYPDWLAAIQSACVLSGKEMVVHHGDPIGPVEGNVDQRVFVTTNERFLLPHSQSEICVIATGISGSFRKTEELTGGSGLHAFMDASALIVQGLTYPGARVVTDNILANPCNQTTLLHDLKVQAPTITPQAPSSNLEAAAQRALTLFDRGLPAVGATAALDPELFFIETKRSELRERVTVLDITGGPRLLLNGPQITLPKGKWRATIRFAVDEDASRYGLRFEWGRMDDVSTTKLKTMTPGVFELSIEQTLAESARCEFRVQLTQGAMHGSFEFFGVRVTKVA